MIQDSLCRSLKPYVEVIHAVIVIFIEFFNHFRNYIIILSVEMSHHKSNFTDQLETQKQK